MADALIGYSGFVGTTLLRQRAFEYRYRSTNIQEIAGTHLISWSVQAPRHKSGSLTGSRKPEADLQKLEGLMGHLETIACEKFILISTVDVLTKPLGVTEESLADESDIHPYGFHRRILERFVEDCFSSHLIVRLPRLVGPGLRKNIVFDFLNENNLSAIDSRGVFQFYPMVNLWYDIQSALRAGLRLVHFTAEPISVAEVAAEGFGVTFDQVLFGEAASYDMRSVHAALFGGTGAYQYSKRETIQAIRAYAQSEPRTLKAVKEFCL